MTGEKHHRWGGGYHSETGRARRSAENSEWRMSVFRRDDFTCACCGVRGKPLEAHHIQNFSSNPELRFDTTNGITMCKNCHSMHIEGSFHKIYGVRDNSKQQLEEYFETKNTYFKGVFSYEENIKGVLDKWHQI